MEIRKGKYYGDMTKEGKFALIVARIAVGYYHLGESITTSFYES